MPSQAPVLPEMFSWVLLVLVPLALAKKSIFCESYGTKFMLGELMLIEPVATKATLEGVVLLSVWAKLMFPLTRGRGRRWSRRPRGRRYT